MSVSRHAVLANAVLAVLIASCFAAMAEVAVDRKAFDAYTASPLHASLLTRAVEGIPKDVFQRCPALKSTASQISVIRSVTFGPDGVPNAGAWWQHLPVSGCGDDTILNILYVVSPDGKKIDSVVTVSGSTHADPVLQKDALLFANVGAALRVKDCKSFRPVTSRFEGFGLKRPELADPGPQARFRPWWETWTMTGCGQRADVPMNFTPDATGTRIDVSGGSEGRP